MDTEGYKVKFKVKAIHSFTSTKPGPFLSFEKHDIILVLDQLDSGWWDGWLNNVRGWFPATHVEIIHDEDDSDDLDNGDNDSDRTPELTRHEIHTAPSISTDTSPNETPTLSKRESKGLIVEESSLLDTQKETVHEDDCEPTMNAHMKFPDAAGSDAGSEADGLDVPTAVTKVEDDVDEDEHDDFEDAQETSDTKTIGSQFSTVGSFASFAVDELEDGARGVSHTKEKRPGLERQLWDTEKVGASSVTLNGKKTQTAANSYPTYIPELAPTLKPLSWTSLQSDITSTIDQLRGSAKDHHFDRLISDSSAIVTSIRTMLYSSRSMSKESQHMQEKSLREARRTIMASLSKLVLTAKSVSEEPFEQQYEDICKGASEQQAQEKVLALQNSFLSKLHSDANGLTDAIKVFVDICEKRSVNVDYITPQMFGGPKNSRLRKNNLPRSDSRTSYLDMSKGTTKGDLVANKKLPLDEELLRRLRNHTRDIDELVAKLSLDYISFTYLKVYDTPNDEAIVHRFSNLWKLTKRYFHIIENMDLDPIDQTRVPSLADYYAHRQSLQTAICTLFLAILELHEEKMETASNGVQKSIAGINLAVTKMIREQQEWLKICEDLDSPLSPALFFDTEPGDDEEMRTSWTEFKEIPKSTDPPTHITRSPSEKATSRTASETEAAPASAVQPRKRQPSARATDDSKPWFLSHDYNDDEIEFEKGMIKGGTLSALVERLTMHDTSDMEYVKTFLLTYRSFCTSDQLLDLLEKRYQLTVPESLTPDEAELWMAKKRKFIQLRVFNVIKNWLENYYIAEDKAILDRLEKFANEVIRGVSPFSADQLNRLIRKRKETDADRGLKKMMPAIQNAPEPPITPKNLSKIKLSDINELELARQLCLLDFELYSSIRHIECLDKAWSNDSKEKSQKPTAVNVIKSIGYCNELNKWVISSILAGISSSDEPKEKVAAWKYWIYVADYCRKLNNYNTGMAILSAFDSSPISRLKKSYEALGVKTTQTLEAIRKLFSPSHNFLEIRNTVQSATLPCIPFLGIYLQDLTFLADGNTDEFKDKGLINFFKRQKTADLIHQIKQFQSEPYKFQPVREIQDFVKLSLKKYQKSSMDELYSLSVRIEPKAQSAL